MWIPPNVALTPAVRSLGPAAGALATSLTQAFNAGLSQTVTQLSAALPSARFTALNVYQLQNAIVLNPAAFGFSTVTDACVTPNVPPFTCQHADQYLFWDGIHPTKAGHAALADEALRVLP